MPSSSPVKITLWLYFWLLLLEGVFRKWILPDWSNAFFIIRDPLVVVIYLLAWRARLFPSRPAMIAIWLLATASLAFALTGDSPFVVTLFGLRTDYLHLPLVFVMTAALDRDDVIRFGKWFMLCSVPIVVLMVAQFNAEPEARLNVGVGGVELGQLRGAMGKIRPAGPFSFISGVVSYFTLVASFVIHGWVVRGSYSRLLVMLASAAVVLAIPISISRSLFFMILVVVLFGVTAALRDIRRIPTYVGPLVAIMSVGILAADTVYVQAFLMRWHEAVTAGGGDFYDNVLGRILNEFTQPFELAADAPLFGHGIGVGTIAGARMITGENSFLLAESELARNVLELGPLLGFAFIGWRAWLAGSIVWKSWRVHLSTGEPLGWLLAGASFLSVLNGQWGPSTQLGFAVFGAGLALAALNDPNAVAETDVAFE